MEQSDKGNLEMVKFLLKNEADPNAQMRTGWTAMHAAAKKGHLHILSNNSKR